MPTGGNVGPAVVHPPAHRRVQRQVLDLDEHLALARLGDGLLGVIPVARLGQPDRARGQADLAVDGIHRGSSDARDVTCGDRQPTAGRDTADDQQKSDLTEPPPHRTTTCSTQQLTDDERAIRDRVRAFGEDEVLPVINAYWERAEFPFELVPKLADLGSGGHDDRRLRLPGNVAAGRRHRLARARSRRREPEHVLRRALRVGDGLDRPAGLRRAEGPVASADGPPRADRRLRTHRARARIGLGVAGDRGAARR